MEARQRALKAPESGPPHQESNPKVAAPGTASAEASAAPGNTRQDDTGRRNKVQEAEHDNTDAWKDESRDKRKDERKDEWGRNGKDNPAPSAPQRAVAQRATSCVPGKRRAMPRAPLRTTRSAPAER